MDLSSSPRTHLRKRLGMWSKLVILMEAEIDKSLGFAG